MGRWTSGLQGESDANWERLERRAGEGHGFIQQREANDDFPTVACDLA